jgi:hypothetical protein
MNGNLLPLDILADIPCPPPGGLFYGRTEKQITAGAETQRDYPLRAASNGIATVAQQITGFRSRDRSKIQGSPVLVRLALYHLGAPEFLKHLGAHEQFMQRRSQLFVFLLQSVIQTACLEAHCERG